MIALGLIETVGYTTAVSAADAAVKAADVQIIGLEKVIGVSGYVGVTVHLSGDVAAVTSAVEAGKERAQMVGELITTEVIARAHSDVQEKLLTKFAIKSDVNEKETSSATKRRGSKKADSKKVKEVEDAAEQQESKKSQKKETKKADNAKKSSGTKKTDDTNES